ncbi:hypothetical protein SA21269_2726 [Staphylococcus aureus subsp. aureus 21269]|nr:hypothetical protein SA21269_2726 [Staphylococcus aureus subsp. aureus 21269]
MSSNKIQTIIVFNVKVQIQSIFISMIPQYIPRKLYIAEIVYHWGEWIM